MGERSRCQARTARERIEDEILVSSSDARADVKRNVCNSCTLRVVYTAYSRAPWLRLIREPLRWVMLAMGRWHGIDAREPEPPTAYCFGCLRWTKTGLVERSAAFRWLNGRVDPPFVRLLWSVVTEEERAEARRFAAQATQTEEGAPGHVPDVIEVEPTERSG